MFTKHLKKALHIALSLQLAFPGLKASNFEDEIVARAKPTRESSLIFTDPNRNRFAFEEYYLGSNGNDCFFNGLGVTRETAINAVTGALARGSAITTNLLDKAIEDQIHESAFEGLQGLPPEEKRAAYLNLYKTNPHMIECAQNIGEIGAVQNHTVTLFDVFAYVYRRNISVYRPAPEATNTLEAFHQVKYKECTQPTLHLLLKGSHFNRLLMPSHGLNARVEALAAETRYLEELRLRVRHERLQDQIDVDQNNLCDDDLPPPLFCEMEKSAAPQDALTVTDNGTSPTGHPSAAQQSVFEEERPAPAPQKKRKIAVSRETVIAFLLKKRATIPDLTYDQSCKNVWVALNQLPSLYERFAGKATLILDHAFTPRGQRREAAIQDLIDRAPRALAQEKENHQVKIYLGRLLMAQKRFDAAWQRFTTTLESPKLSQVGRLYMAQIIIEHGYRPAHLRNPIAYAQELLEASGEPTTPRHSAARSRPVAPGTGYLHNPYLSERASLHTASALAQMVHEEGHQKKPPSTQRARTSTSSAVPQTREPRGRAAQTAHSLEEHANETRAQSPRASQKRLQKEMTPSQEAQPGPPSDAEDLTPKRPRAQDATPSPAQDVAEDETQDFFAPDTPLFDALPRLPRITITNTQDQEEDDDAHASHQSTALSLEHGVSSTYYTKVKSLILQAKAAFMLGKNPAGNALCLDAFEMVDDANPRSLELSDTQRHKIRINVFLQLGNSRYNGPVQGEYLTRIDCFLRALQLAKNTHNKDSQMRALQGLANASYRGTIDGTSYRRHDLYLGALDFARELNDIEGQMRALIGLGNIASFGMYEGHEYTPTECYLRALAFARQLGDVPSQIRALLGLGNASVLEKTPAVRQEKFRYFSQACDLAQRSGSREAHIRALHGMGFTSKISHCIKYYHEALGLCGEDFPELKAAIHKNIDAAHKSKAWQAKRAR